MFLWKDGSIDGPPISRLELAEYRNSKDFDSWEVSPLRSPADRIPARNALQASKNESNPSRIILEIDENPSPSLLREIERRNYEINREFPDQDLLRQATQVLFLGMGGMGGLLSLLSIATFAASYRLVISRAAEQTRNLLLLGFSKPEISKVFLGNFLHLFFLIVGISIVLAYFLLSIISGQAQQIGLELSAGFSFETLFFILVYGIVFVFLNKRVIEKAVADLAK